MGLRANKLLIAVLLLSVAMLHPAIGKQGKKKGPKHIPPEDTVLAIYSVEPMGVDASLARALTPHLIMVINKYRDEVRIVQSDAVDKALELVGLANSGACTDTECLPELGKILGANRFLVASLSKLGKTYTIIATVYDAESGVAMFTESDKCKCAADDLPIPMERLANRIMAKLNGKKAIKPPPPEKPDVGAIHELPNPKKEDVPKPEEIKFIPSTPEDQKKCPTDMVYVPAGWFMMGCNAARNSRCRQNEYPYHAVYLDAYCIDKYEYPNQQGAQPKKKVRWNEAQSICSSLGKRLPTEAEWEKAARGTDGRTYPWGEGIDKSKARYGKYFGGAKPSGSYNVNVSPYGAYDMAGNVWEWTSDWYGEDFYQVSPTHNPKGASSGTYRVLRGGAWRAGTGNLRSSARGWYFPVGGVSAYDIGFRCAQ